MAFNVHRLGCEVLWGTYNREEINGLIRYNATMKKIINYYTIQPTSVQGLKWVERKTDNNPISQEKDTKRKEKQKAILFRRKIVLKSGLQANAY